MKTGFSKFWEGEKDSPSFEKSTSSSSILYTLKIMKMVPHILIVLLSITSTLVHAYDPSPLQDICVAILDSEVLVNGFVCKAIKEVTADDFFLSGFDEPSNTMNNIGFNVKNALVNQIPGLNTLGISLVRLDFAPYGENPPHTHPRATEILTVLEGELFVGFVLSNQNNNTLISKVLYKGDVFVFPIGLIHFQANIGDTPAVAISGLSSQNPGVITIANSMVPHILIVLLSITSSLVHAYDPSPLQDICVAILDSEVLVNGFVCKAIKEVTADDFFLSGFDKPSNTMNKVGFNVTNALVNQIPGLNTLGISLVRLDFAPYGENPPHTHPRATEILTVLEGTLFVGFVLSNQNNNTLISKVLYKGDVFVFPIGLIHFQANVGDTPAVAISGLSSQNPGVITIANSVFGSKPPISNDILAKAFQVDKKMMKMVAHILVIVLFSIASSLVYAYDPSPLQDICVADLNSEVLVNGFVCKAIKEVTADDFFLSGFDEPSNTMNNIGFNVKNALVNQIPGLNTLGISLVRLDFAPYGENPPHTHPRATEILTVLKGTLFVGFVLSNQNNNTLISKVLYKGDVFVFPIGLIHFQANIGDTPAVAISGLSSQNPGVITIANSVFGSKPPISDDILAKAFQLDKKTMKMIVHIPVVLFISIASSLVYAYDPSPLQDICVADFNSKVLVNGFVCKAIKESTAGDFFLAGLDKPGNTVNKVGSNVTMATVNEIPGLNTLGISLVRIDYAPDGVNPPHTHPRATEILTVLEGTLYVGFVLSNQNNNTLLSKILKKGDVFVFPIGLIHFQANIGNMPAVAIASLNSQNPGVITIANAVFGSKPPISDYVLAKAFQVDKKVIDYLQAQFWLALFICLPMEMKTKWKC
ncbi:putative germin-like protein 2-1 [Cinnamomum micranthum f. kanehirae]|uniref:Putative germin-like protein 2-1 n=1 Tax=Cinnamomum micranthum f. kanehirae TaxID=337451 RepID=A0A3S3MDZ1_9MAGN|nr:putative germin-like protein 2-1 [Cinnamomum micranthum f. kanehirae]